MDCAQKRGTCQRCGGRRCGQARVPINTGLLLFTSRRPPTKRSCGEGGLRLHWPTLATAARNRVHKAARNVFRPAHSSAESRLSARRSGAGQSGSAIRVAAVTTRYATSPSDPFLAARCTIPRGLLSSRFLNSAARSQAPAAGRHSMLSGSQITSSTPLVQYVINEDTVTKREFILEPFLRAISWPLAPPPLPAPPPQPRARSFDLEVTPWAPTRLTSCISHPGPEESSGASTWGQTALARP